MNHKKNHNDKVYFRRTLLGSAVVIGLQAMAMPTAAQACATSDGSNNIQVAQGEICYSGIAPEQPVNDINNAGTVYSEVYGVHITGDSPVAGDIENALGGVIDTVDNGIYIDGGTVNGSIINNGSITSENDHALDLEEATIGGNIIINGNLTSKITYDAIDVNDSNIQGDVIVTSSAILTGDDGIDIDESVVGGSVISEATINARREGFDLDNTTITNDLINRGQINAGRNGLSFSGEAEYIYPEIDLPMEEGPGEIMVISEPEIMEEPDLAITKMTIGGNFTNEGNIDAGKRGVKLELVDIGGSFTNSGTIESATDTAIFVSSSTIEGDFINRGDLYADQPEAYEPGDLYYKSNNDTPITEGDNIVLTVLGVDSYNQVWLKISNEGTERKEMLLEGPDGIIFPQERLDTGQEIFVNVGEYDGGARSYQLIDLRTETPEVLASVTESNQSFSPAIPDSDQEQKGIAMFGNRYDDEEMQTGAVSIGGDFINEGAISAIEEAIFLHDTTIGGNFNNSGLLTSLDSDGILFLGNVSIGGEFINTGNISAEHSGIFLDGDAELGDGVLAGGNKILIGRNFINEGNITAQDHGIALFGTEVDGNFINRGDITVEQEGSAIYLSNSLINGNLENYGDLTVVDDEDDEHGLYVEESLIKGNIINDGNITVSDTEGIYIENSIVEGSILSTENTAIKARSDAIIIEDSEVYGSLINNSSLIAEDHDGIDLNDSLIDGDVVNTGAITSGDNAIEVDGESEQYMVITGSLINTGNLTTLLTDDGGPSDNGNGFDFDYVNINTNLDNSGNIDSDYHGFLIQGSRFGELFINSGDLNVAQKGIVLESKEGDEEENHRVMIGNGFINNGNINSVQTGIFFDGVDINGTISDSNTSFLNAGTIDTRMGAAITLDDTTMAGDIVNTGLLSSSTVNAWEPGDSYQQTAIDEPLTNENPWGIEIEAIGKDADGNAWFRIRHDSDEYGTQPIRLYEESGELSYSYGGLEAGKDLYVNLGIINGTVNLMPEFMGGPPDVDLPIFGSAIPSDEPFMPEYFDRYGIEVVDSQIAGIIINQGDIDAYHSAIVMEDANISGGINNSGIVTSGYDAAINVVNSSLGTILNTGTINGGAVFGDMVEAGRTISDGSTVAMDLRTALSRLDFQNSGTVNGDIYGTTQTDDVIELLSGALNSNIFDVESINVTGRTTISGDIFSVNDSSTLTIAETGTLVVGAGDQIKVEGRFIQDGTLAATLEQGVTDPAEPLIDVTSTATLNENSTVTLALADRNIAGFISDFAGNDIHLIGAAGGVTDNGMVTQADSLLFSYETVIKDADTTLGVNGRVNDLGEIVASNGAGVNAASAISTLQGENSGGLVDLYTSNSELYNAIYDASLDDLTVLAEELASGNPATGIAASQNAQNEAVNTILNRIADLRSGASGISAGDSQSLSVRPDSVWIGGIYSDGEQDASGELGSYNLKSKGFTLGADKDINDYLTLGLGVTVVNSTAKQSNQGGIGNNSETDSYLGSFYASWRDGGYFIDGNFNMGVSRTDLSGRVGNNSWKSDFNSKQMLASVKVGKSFLFNNNDTLVEPSIGVNYSRLKSDGYDYNAGVNTHVKSATLSALEAGIGVRAITSIELGSGLLLPEASVMAWHDFKADSVETDISFENSGDSFTYFGPKGIKNRYQISVGAEYQMGNNVTLSASYDHNWQSGFKADTVQAKLRYDF